MTAQRFLWNLFRNFYRIWTRLCYKMGHYFWHLKNRNIKSNSKRKKSCSIKGRHSAIFSINNRPQRSIFLSLYIYITAVSTENNLYYRSVQNSLSLPLCTTYRYVHINFFKIFLIVFCLLILELTLMK